MSSKQQRQLAVRAINGNIKDDVQDGGEINALEMIIDRLREAAKEKRINSLADIEFEFKEVVGEMIDVTIDGLEEDQIS